MNAVVFPLNQQSQGADVVNLQEALNQAIERGALLANDPVARRELTALVKRERTRQAYGDGTARLVSTFQAERRMRATGEVDQPTADALNALLRQWGLLDATPDSPAAAASSTRVVFGAVRREDGGAIRALRVRVSHDVPPGSIRLGEDTTDSDGRYTIRYDTLPGVDVVNLVITAIDDRNMVVGVSDAVPNAKAIESINLTIGVDAGPVRLAGVVFNHQGQPVEPVTLRAYRREFGKQPTLLKETTSGANGRYAFALAAAEASRGLEVRAVKADNSEEVLSEPLNDLAAESLAQVNLVIPKSLQTARPEYQRLTETLTPEIGGAMANLAKARETAAQQDLTVLNRATGWDARLIALAAMSERLAADADLTGKLSAETLYALLRVGLPSDKRMLAQVEPASISEALNAARTAGIVDMNDAAIAQAEKQFTGFAETVRWAMPAPGSSSTYTAFLKGTGLTDDEQKQFAAVYHRHGGDAATLWTEAVKAGLKQEQITKLRLQGKLAYLGGNAEPVTAHLMKTVKKDPAELVDQDFHTAARWQSELFEVAGIPAGRRNALTEADRKNLDALIPPAYEAPDTQTRLASYAGDMARKMRLSYPTRVLARQMETEPSFTLPSAHDSTVKLLKGAAAEGFTLGETPVSSFLRSNPSITAGLSAAEAETAGQQLKMLHRVYQITPDNESMPVMMQLNITAAFDVTAYDEGEFVRMFRHKYFEVHKRPAPSGVPELISRKAKQVSSITYNLFAITRKIDSEPPVAGMSAPLEERERVKNALIKHYPTLESLFGSMDYCECEHCRSVLSPAAYFVDLLQFVDVDGGVWSNFLAEWKNTHGNQDYPHQKPNGDAMKPYDALVERRPDLTQIALTCDNTHTALPYIDIVNEILEYYVANGALSSAAAHDTAGATTAELLAEPQNVIREAYDAVRGARYPLNLPFDLWVETVRQFCDYCETPLHQLLSTFRTRDDLFAAAEPFDRSAIFLESIAMSPEELGVFTDPDPLTGDRWFALYGYPIVRTAIQGPTNATNATVSVANADAAKITPGLAYSFFDTSANAPSAEARIVSAVGAANSGGAGRTRITFDGTWTVPPDAGDQLICDAPAMLRSAKTLSRRLRVTFKETAELVQAGFVNPELGKLAILYKLGVTIADAQFYLAHRGLLAQNAGALSTDDQKRRLEAQAFQTTLNAAATRFNVPVAQLEAAIQAIPFGRILVLADPDAGCDFDLTTLRYADGTKADPIVYLRINLLVRMWRKLGWSLEETDRALQVLVPKNTPYESAHLNRKPLLSALIHLAHLKSLDERIRAGSQSRIKLLTLWSDIPVTGKKPLYAQLFLTRSVLKSAPVFDEPLGRYLTAAGVKLKTHILAVQGALGLSADDIGRILIDAGQTIDGADLTMPVVSVLYRHGLLAKALKLSVRELILLKQLSGLDPFKALHADPLAAIEEDHPFSQTLEFVSLIDELKSSGVTIDDLDYLLRHRFDPTGKYRVDPDARLATLTTLSEGIRAIRIEHAVPDDPGGLTDEFLAQKLGLALAADVVTNFLAMMNGTAEFTAVKVGITALTRLPASGFAGETGIREVPFNVTRGEQKLTYRGVLFDAEKAALKARLPIANPHVVSPLLSDLLDDAQRQARRFFDLNLLKQGPGVQPASGFLAAADYAVLFEPLAAGATEAQLRARDQQRRTVLANAFMPYLQTRLIRQFIVDTITAQTGGERVLIESLLVDARLLDLPGRALDALESSADRGVTTVFWNSVDATGASSAPRALPTTNTGHASKPPGTNSAAFEGYLVVPATGAYRFYIELDQQNAEAELRFRHLMTPLFIKGAAAAAGATLGDQANEFLELKAGVPYHFSLRLTNLNNGNARMLVHGETLPKGPLSQLVLYPAAALDAADRATTLLAKALQVSTALKFNERECRYLLTHAADFGGVSFSELPTVRVGDGQADRIATEQRFRRFRRLAAYARLKTALGVETDDLIAIFEANGTAAADRLVKEVYPRIARLTRRDDSTVKDTAEALVKAPAVPAFANERPLQRLWDALLVVDRFGARPASLVDWTRIVAPATTPEARFEIARGIKEALKARVEPEAWQRMAQPIFDRLRQRQRDALVSFVLQQLGLDRLEQLYEYFLIDPGMEPVVQTSRMRLASASVQLFIQRCLLNLEPKVHPSTINSRQWEWMRRYRVWEANRRIFLFPENLLEPEFRDDKTHLYGELEAALLQSDVSNDLVEDAFLNYLKKLDELARLDIVAMHIEDNADPSLRTLHVFGRTYAQPHKYFYRRYARQMWTPWEPVSAEISGDHLLPVVWRSRLYLFWVTFVEKVPPPPAATVDPTKPILIPAVSAKLEAQLHWSEYLHGEWSMRESSAFDPPDAARLQAIATNPRKIYAFVSKLYDQGEERGVKIHLSWPFNQSFHLAGRNSTPERDTVGSLPSHPYTPTYDTQTLEATKYGGSGPLKVTFASTMTTTASGYSPGAVVTPPILKKGAAFNLLACDNELTNFGIPEDAYENAANPTEVKKALERGLQALASLSKPVFYQDNRHTLFVEPEVTERTVEEWEEWVTHPPQPGPELKDPDWWKKIRVEPKFPQKFPRIPIPEPDPGDLYGPLINPVSKEKLTTKGDWLVNSMAVLMFDDSVVGPNGTPGGDVLSDISRDRESFVRSGLKSDGVRLNVVGGGGFNAAMEEHLQNVKRHDMPGTGPNRSMTGRIL